MGKNSKHRSNARSGTSSSSSSSTGAASAAVHRQHHPQQHHANELLNFRFATSAASRQETSQRYDRIHNNNNNNSYNATNNNRNGRNNYGGGNNNRSNNRGDRRRKEDRSSARKKANDNMFYLHSSAEHAFVLTRQKYHRQRSNHHHSNDAEKHAFSVAATNTPATVINSGGSAGSGGSSYTFNGSDESVRWDDVRIVKQLVPIRPENSKQNHQDEEDQSLEPSCPICLCDLVCGRITKCGHTFCLSCLLRHVQTQAATNPYQDVKCPCCGLHVLIGDVRPVLYEYIVPPIVNVNANNNYKKKPKSSYSQQQPTTTLRLRKLHRQKMCSAPFVPHPNSFMHSNPHSAPSMTDDDAKFCRFNYVDTQSCVDLLLDNRRQLLQEIASLPPPTGVRGIPNANPSSYATDVERIYLNMALEIVMTEEQHIQNEAEPEQTIRERFEQPTSGMYQYQSPYLIYNTNNSPNGSSNDHHDHNNEHNDDFNHDNSSDNNNSHIDENMKASTTTMMFENETSREPPVQHEKNQLITSEEGMLTAMTDRNHPSNVVDHDSYDHDDNIDVGRLGRPYRGDSIGSYTSIDSVHTPVSNTYLNEICEGDDNDDDNTQNHPSSPRTSPSSPNSSAMNTKKKNRAKNKPSGSMYLDETEAHHFYQADDGQLVFLSGFNMTCLLSDYSKSKPADPTAESSESTTVSSMATTFPQQVKPPLPDTVEGCVLEIENIHLTPEIRKRMPFLSHIPFYTDISFVELDLFHILTESTRRKFKVEFAKRRQRRMAKLQAEKRADKAAKRHETEIINERKARLQIIDPEDEFFRTRTIPEISEPAALTSEDFGPALGGSINNSMNPEDLTASDPVLARDVPTSSTVSFSEACRRGNNDVITISSTDAFPALGAPSGDSFPALGGGSVEKQNNPNPAHASTHVAPSVPGGKKGKKSKGKKISLFSTGGQRGY